MTLANIPHPGLDRLTRGKTSAAGVASGPWMGLFIGIVFTLFGNGNQIGFIVSIVTFGALFGLIWSQVTRTALTRRGTRDFSSVSQVIATKYEVLVEHRLANAHANSWPTCLTQAFEPTGHHSAPVTQPYTHIHGTSIYFRGLTGNEWN